MKLPLVAAVLAALTLSSATAVYASPRIRHTINDAWRYAPGPIDGAEVPRFDDSGWQSVHLPHTWNVEDARDKAIGYRRGEGWYRRDLTVDRSLRGRRIFLYFEGANQVADVWVNGAHAGQHIGGYTAFVFDITAQVRFDQPNTIAVRVDNSHHPDIPPLNADFTFYGGIYRDVWLIAAHPLHFTVTDHASPGVFVDTPEVSADRGTLRIRGSVANASTVATNATVVHRLFDPSNREVGTTSARLAITEDSTPFEGRMEIERPRLWSPRSPHLYRLQSELRVGDRVVDAIDNPVGFRWFRAHPDRGFSLNGQPLRLAGSNRHQDHHGLGNALSDAHHRRDIEIIRDDGFNFLRLAHYPQDPAVLDAADRLGLVVWEEIPVVNMIGMSDAFLRNSERMLVEMIRQHYNHPSIVFRGYMNEVLLIKPDPVPPGYRERVVEVARRLETVTRAEDPHRLTVMALSRDEVYDDGGIGDIPMVLGLNLYFGWYYEQIEALGPFLDEFHRRKPNRPLIVSEYGADSDERVHTRNPRPFDFSSEQAQRFHVLSWPQIESRPWLVGSAVWNHFDFGSELRHDTKHALNQKGLWYYDRTPKDIAFYYRSALRDRPLLHIAREWSRAAGRSAEHPVRVYTNLSEVELVVNGAAAGKRHPANRMAEWTVALRDGANEIVARGGSIEDRATFHFQVREDRDLIAINCGAEYAYTDATGLVWEADRNFSGGEAKRTLHRIYATSDDPLFQTWREGTGLYRFDVPPGVYEVQTGSTRDHTASRRSERREVSADGITVEFTPERPLSAILIRRLYGSE